MARLGSTAIGGYYPTPDTLIGRLASLVKAPCLPPDETDWRKQEPTLSVVDPCAGDGAAVVGLLEHITGGSRKVDFWTVEMEVGRHQDLRKRLNSISWKSEMKALLGDAFQVTWDLGKYQGSSLLFLNPPYDLDRDHGRLEERFLDRFAGTLADGGVLLFLVPGYALKASAETLARRFRDLRAYRFPDPEWESFKQVVLVAKKAPDLLAPDPTLVSLVEGFSADPLALPILPEACETPLEIPNLSSSGYGQGFENWRMQAIDLKGLLAKALPWHQKDRTGKIVPIRGVLPEGRAQDLLLRKYPAAMPPRPAHIAAGIASGIFNGARIEPDNPLSGLPPVLVKGVFDKEYRTIETKRNKAGEEIAHVQVQRPKLVVTILDLITNRYHTLKTGDQEKATVEDLTVAGLLKHYGGSLLKVMADQCPVLYDPRRDAEDIPLPTVRRRPFTAQAHAARAIVRLLGGPLGKDRTGKGRRISPSRRDQNAILLGEIGSGKSTVALLSARTIGARKMLVLCPPHLLTSWANEVVSTLGEDGVTHLLKIPEDVDAFSAIQPDGRLHVGVLSREAAKLGHGWASIQGMCPTCGSELPENVDFAKKRATCEATAIHPKTELARQALQLAYALQPLCPNDPTVSTLLTGRHDRLRAKAYKSRGDRSTEGLTGLPATWLDDIANELVTRRLAAKEDYKGLNQAIGRLFFAFPEEEKILQTVRTLVKAEDESGHWSWDGPHVLARDLLLLIRPERAREVEADFPDTRLTSSNQAQFKRRLEDLELGRDVYSEIGFCIQRKGETIVDGEERSMGSKEAMAECLRHLGPIGKFVRSAPCGERLFQAIPAPRRVPLAKYICRRHPDCFDLLVVDEAQEVATEGSAQEKSAHRLTALGKPSILLSGSIMNGYAESLFTNLWAVSPAFRAEFGRDQKARFVERYGYRKRVVDYRDEKNEVVAFGAVTDRTEKRARVTGEAEGVLPLLVLGHLLPLAVTLHKEDLAIDLPPCEQKQVEILPDAEVLAYYRVLQSALATRIRGDMFKKDLAGKLWGQLAELPSYLDRATSGYEIRYPEACGGGLVASAPPTKSTGPLAKERWMLDEVERQIGEGRNVLIFAWHTELLPRLARLISERIDATVPVLHANKVPTGKRQDWIDREVIRKKHKVLVANPVTVQTGLNNLIHFATEIWMENPACNPITYRQAMGRVDRIGQTKPTRILFPTYTETLQEQLYGLLLRKVAVSVSTDGLDPESALRAAGGIEDGYLAGLSIGKQLWAMFEEEGREAA